jgi:transcriptional regulator NrdR family protein
MHCPACRHKKSRIIRTQPDSEFSARDLVRQCRNPVCLAVFTSREALVSLLEKSQDGEIVKEMAARVGSLSADTRQALLKLLQAG